MAAYTTAPVTFAMKPNRLWRQLTKHIDFSRPDADEARLRHAIQIAEGLPRKGRKAKHHRRRG